MWYATGIIGDYVLDTDTFSPCYYIWRVRQDLDLRNVREHVHRDYKSGALNPSATDPQSSLGDHFWWPPAGEAQIVSPPRRTLKASSGLLQRASLFFAAYPRRLPSLSYCVTA